MSNAVRPNKIGIHNLVFTDVWDEPRARQAIDTAARIGFDVIEVLLFDPANIDAKLTRKLAADAGIGIAIGMALGPDTDISSTDQATARRGEATVERCLEVAVEAGASAASGICYAAFNRYTAPPSAAQRDQVCQALGRLDVKAGSLGVRLGLEAVNRYESYMVNTIDQAGDMIRAVGGKNLFIHIDTFHANIEESDIAGAVARNAGLIGYVHVAENTRGSVGCGSFDFRTLFRALARGGYAGGYTIESFSPSVLGPGIVGAIGLWRQPWDNAEAAARAALALIEAETRAATSASKAW